MENRVLKVLEFDIIRERLAALASSEISKKVCEELVPETDYSKVIELLNETDDGVSMITKRGRPPLGGIMDVVASVKRACGGGILSFIELLQIAGVLKAARRMLNYCGEESESDNIVAREISELIEDYRLESDIYRCILSEDEMSDDASPQLSDIRRKIVNEQNSIRDKLNDFIHSQKYAKAIQDEVVTMRGDRYCIPVKAEYKGEFPGMVHDMSGSGQTLFIEPAAVVESNNKIRELRIKEKQEIERITLLLGSLCAERADIIISDVRLLGRIDFAFAKASLALQMKAQKPQVNNEGRIKIIKGKHPLIEQHKVVPISIHIGRDFNTLVITGPNTGGKTVTLKTVGLFTLMMQSGLLVPCECTSELSVFENVFADIGDEQSIAQNLSTFSAHMSNIVKIVNGTNDKSLVLLDELGSGTDPTEGAALAMSILECLYQMGAKTLATTHYSELKAFTVATEGFENACCEFDVETLSPTYKLMIGIPGKSNAFAISQKLGLDGAIITRAREFLSSEDIRFEDVLQDIEGKRSEIDKKEREIKELTAEIERMRSEVGAEKAKIEEQRQTFVRKAREEAAEIVREAKKNADGMISELRNLCRDAEEDNRARLRAGEAIGRDFSKMRNDTAEDSFKAQKKELVEGDEITKDTILLPGQNLYSVSIDGNVTVIKPIDKDGNVYVGAGIMKMYLPISDLKVVGKIEKKEDRERTRKVAERSIVHDMAQSFKPEIDLRGMTVEEAKMAADNYIDNARMCHMETVTLLHGKGTGVLRKELQQMLRKDKRVKEFRNGEFGEGDFGVTIVKLKV